MRTILSLRRARCFSMRSLASRSISFAEELLPCTAHTHSSHRIIYLSFLPPHFNQIIIPQPFTATVPPKLLVRVHKVCIQRKRGQDFVLWYRIVRYASHRTGTVLSSRENPQHTPVSPPPTIRQLGDNSRQLRRGERMK